MIQPRSRVRAAALAAALAAAAPHLHAQLDLQLPLQYGLQQLHGNPAALQGHRVSVSLPSVSIGGYTPIAIAEAGTVRDGTLYVAPERMMAALDPAGNEFAAHLSAEVLAVNFRRRNWQAGVSYGARVHGTFDLPRDLAGLAAYGNARYVGETLVVAPSVDAFAYQEIGVNGAVAVSELLTIGGRVKFLVGSAAIATQNADARIYTDPAFYAAEIQSNVSYASAGVDLTLDTAGVTLGDLDDPFGGGTGFGFDLGVVLRPADKLEVGLSVRDLGAIAWTGNATRHRSNGAYRFAGYEGSVFNENDEVSFDVRGTLDSIVAEMGFEKTEETFRTALPTTLQSTARYALTERTSLHATLLAQMSNSVRAGFGVGGAHRVGEWLQAGLLTGVRHGGFFLGANATVDVKGVQLYAACDDLLALAAPNDANVLHVRAGVNLAFGKIKSSKRVRGWYDTKVEGINR